MRRFRRQATRPRPRGAAACALALAALAAPGCARRDAGEAGKGAEPAWAYERESRENPASPVSMVLRLDKVEIGLADTIVLEQELRVPPGFEADFPEYLPEDFDGFSVTDIRESPPAGAAPPGQEPPPPPSEPDGAGPGAAAGSSAPAPSVRTKRLVLEPDRSGELAIAPLAVYFHPTGQDAETFFLTDEVKVVVRPIEDAAALDIAPHRGVLAAPPAPRGGGLGLWILGGSAALAVAVAVFFLVLRRERAAPPAVPPHEVAWESLRRLVALGLVEKGEIEQFFVILSAILREYIESRFQVRAPERTTEEFLEEASRHPALDVHRTRLGQFLALCDQVKFARYQPDDAAIQGAFDVTKQFIDETTPRGGA